MSRILLVDADPGERLIVRSRVTDLGHHVTTTDTGAKGLVEARSSVFDLILLAQNLGGGVDGAIHRAGGARILEECRRLGGCATGDAKITTGGDLPADFVIHAVGPVYRGGDSGEAELLAGCFRRSIELAEEKGLKSIAFPAISCGVYGYPISEAAPIAIETVRTALERARTLDRVRFVLFSEEDFGVFEAALADSAAQG